MMRRGSIHLREGITGRPRVETENLRIRREGRFSVSKAVRYFAGQKSFFIESRV